MVRSSKETKYIQPFLQKIAQDIPPKSLVKFLGDGHSSPGYFKRVQREERQAPLILLLKLQALFGDKFDFKKAHPLGALFKSKFLTADFIQGVKKEYKNYPKKH